MTQSQTPTASGHSVEDQLRAQVKFFVAENNACKQIINESMQTSLNLRTNLSQLQDSNDQLSKSNSAFIQHVQNLLVKIQEQEDKLADNDRVITQLREALGQVPAPEATPEQEQCLVSECDAA